MRTMFIGLCLASLAACGDSGAASTASGSTTDATTSTTSTTATTSTTTDVTGEPVTSAPTTGETTTGDTTGASASGDPTSSPSQTPTGTTDTGDTGDDTTTGATSPLKIAVVDAYLLADCTQPTPDPVEGGWYVEFDNFANQEDTAAILKSASLSLLAADPPVLEPITVQPTESGPITAGEQVSQEMIKLPGDMHSACDHCDEFYLLVLEYDEAGVSHHVEEEVTVVCG